jgi:hypothetical protein
VEKWTGETWSATTNLPIAIGFASCARNLDNIYVTGVGSVNIFKFSPVDERFTALPAKAEKVVSYCPAILVSNPDGLQLIVENIFKTYNYMDEVVGMSNLKKVCK